MTGKEVFQLENTPWGMHKFLGCDAGDGRFVHFDRFGHVIEYHGLHGFFAIFEEVLLLLHDTVGYLEQEPHLDESKTVKEIVQEGVQEVVDLLKAYEEVNAKFAEPMDDDEMNRLI